MKKLILAIFILPFFLACDMEELPKADLSKKDLFSSPEGLEMYTNSFYNTFPTRNLMFNSLSYYLATSNYQKYLRKGAYTPEDQGGWSWSELRNINFFIANNNDENVAENIRNNYEGMARFFRAYFYFSKMKTFGDVPWIDHPLDVEDPLLFAGRDSRTMIVEKIKEDLDYAIANIKNDKDGSASTITSSVAALFKSRVCLWEGTFRKYHPDQGLQSSAGEWLQEAVNAAEYVMSKGYSIHTGDPKTAYRELFLAVSPIADEVLYAVIFDGNLGIVHDGNHSWTSSTWTGTPALVNAYVNTYLMLDGTPFTDIEGFDQMSFPEECAGRDYRLHQTIKTPGYTRIRNGQEFADFCDFNVGITGYQPIKFMFDDTFTDNQDISDNNIVVFRFAEVLLNYAEAKAELGTLTDTDWSKTIGALRARAGITGGLDQKPVVVDTYLQQRFFPNVSDPSILEIRRERGIELSMEGFGFEDLQRWRVGELLSYPLEGIFIPELEVPYDFSGNGEPDIVFTTDLEFSEIPGLVNLFVGPIMASGSASNYQLAEDGHRLIYLKDEIRTWEDKLYFRPIPSNNLVKNPNLGQNPGW